MACAGKNLVAASSDNRPTEGTEEGLEMGKATKPERYSSRKQEACFQPLRVRVLKGAEGVGSSYRRERYYRVVIQDMSTRQIVAEYIGGWYHWNKAPRWHWSDQWPSDIEKPDHTRGRLRLVRLLAKARNVAKQAAKDRHLPFDLKRDVVFEVEILNGPKQPCLLCGEPDARGWSGTVCEACRLDAKVGKQQKAEGEACYLDNSRLLDYRVGRLNPANLGRRFFCALWALARVVPQRPKTRKIETYGELLDTPKGRRRANCLVYLSPDQKLAVRDIIGLVSQIAENAYDLGYSTGESILNKIADLSDRTVAGRRGS